MLIVLFEPIWFIPPDSYLTEFYYGSDYYFPSDGELVTVYMTQLNYSADTAKIEDLTYNLENATDIVTSMSVATIMAPAGFSSYQWSTGSNVQTISVDKRYTFFTAASNYPTDQPERFLHRDT